MGRGESIRNGCQIQEASLSSYCHAVMGALEPYTVAVVFLRCAQQPCWTVWDREVRQGWICLSLDLPGSHCCLYVTSPG